MLEASAEIFEFIKELKERYVVGESLLGFPSLKNFFLRLESMNFQEFIHACTLSD